ncbi:hypothetical protein BBO99_00000339 [Phytophthora kernoviae]|uniref:BTB domain-containing protein n=2 Tax=Phytophthora kernoviae TaxID=325452 RepID=A0A3R7G0F5_9STRA|nr:hypothetical protein G195_000777 [Phytophthora kernoviae 00238/432]KAG2532866.1 hypothetical protein JM16_000097 [Phytophthora kernoviae]KAG2533593.1 hypothetical protein JM18_000099 [Phytophthora kernoviae]RLN11112.1 hypothetical protein BBI17_000122 [Phytophthora kernoviae]RLN86057.1 hypothetical protein BBO99_00000339 [Phytophthora kernoviae]
MYIFGGSDNHYDRESISSRSSSEYGRSDSGRHVNDMHSFNLETNSWSLIRTTGEVPYPRERASMLVHEKTCLLFGGYDHDLGYLNDVHIFTFESHVWSTLETKGTAPSGCHSPLALAHSNSMFVFGGKTGPDLYELDLESNTWEPVECDGASPRSNHPAGCVYDGDFFILGGDDKSASFKQIHLQKKKDQSTEDEVTPDDEGTAMAYLRLLVNNQLMSDVTFIVEGGPVYGHKNLCVRCSYFRAMFTGEMQESTAREVEITDVSRSTFLSLLEYVYTDRMEVLESGLKDLFIAADRYGIDSLKRVCTQKLSKSISVDNAASILQAADQHNAPKLRDECFQFTLRNFDAVSKTPLFLEMARTNIELALQILQRR